MVAQYEANVDLGSAALTLIQEGPRRNKTYELVSDWAKEGKRIRIYSTSFVDDLRKRYDLQGNIEYYLISDIPGEHNINPGTPSLLERSIEGFLEPGVVIVIDGIEEFLNRAPNENDGRVIQSLHHLRDLAHEKRAAILLPVYPEALNDKTALERLKILSTVDVTNLL
ncbi:MAG: DUF835 domain-containing protein [Nanoarchaeota archaeon]|nr:DUF835 domain-containing protein [Nanoarchaeota archaeon]